MPLDELGTTVFLQGVLLNARRQGYAGYHKKHHP